MILKIEEQLRDEVFCWLGYFTSQRANRNLTPESLRLRGKKGPLFNGNGTNPEVFPDYGCHCVMLRRDWIPEMVARLRMSVYPHGFDRWIFSEYFCTDEQFNFTGWALSGQQYARSGSWGKLHQHVGKLHQLRTMLLQRPP